MKRNAARSLTTATTVRTPLLVAALSGAALIAGCGGGGGSAPKAPQDALLFVRSFSLPNFSGVFLDEDAVFRFSAPVKEGSINPDSIQIRTGASGGVSPIGVFVRGTFLVDPSTSNRVVIDRDQITENLISRVERSGNLSRIPDNIRIDLGFDAINGQRQPLFDRSESDTITFVPEIPTRAALDDTGYTAGSTYTVAVPGFPATNTLTNKAGGALLNPNNRVFTSSFTTVPSNSGQLFLGSESSGPPRVIHSDPFNGDDQVDLSTTIQVRFSQPLDPRTAADAANYKLEIISVPAPFPQVPVSVFLAQQRLGKCEVTLTPIQVLQPNATYRLTLTQGIEDLVGQSINPTVLSFFTGVGTTPFAGSLIESFSDETLSSAADTTAVWNGNKPFVGATPGALTAAFAPYAGDGSDGAFAAVSGQTTTIDTGSTVQRVYNFTQFDIPIGATVVGTGSHPLVIHVQGDITIDGTLDVSGQDGDLGLTGTLGDGLARGGDGGTAGPGGGDGGVGAFNTIGGGGNFDGVNGFGSGGGKGGFTGNQDLPAWTRTRADAQEQTCTLNGSGQINSFEQCRNREGGGGGGFGAAGSDAENDEGSGLSRDGAIVPNGGKGGPAWGDSSFSNASTSAVVLVNDGNGGTQQITLTGIPTLVALQGGSGGGGGGGEDDKDGGGAQGSAGDEDEGGAGGGGGGGAVQLVSFGGIFVNGTIRANGGDGGDSSIDEVGTDFGQGAGGGGGSGGAIWLQCRGEATLDPLSIIEALGGSGGSGYAQGTTQVFVGGDGGEGRIRVEDGDGIVNNAPGIASVAAFSPALDLFSVGQSTWQNTGIFTPDFSEPVVDADVAGYQTVPVPAFTGSIRIYMEGAPEDVSNIIEDPALGSSTGWVLVYDTDQGGILAGSPWDLLDNNKWWRFKVEFDVNQFHLFSDAMPTVREIEFVIEE